MSSMSKLSNKCRLVQASGLQCWTGCSTYCEQVAHARSSQTHQVVLSTPKISAKATKKHSPFITLASMQFSPMHDEVFGSAIGLTSVLDSFRATWGLLYHDTLCCPTQHTLWHDSQLQWWFVKNPDLPNTVWYLVSCLQANSSLICRHISEVVNLMLYFKCCGSNMCTVPISLCTRVCIQPDTYQPQDPVKDVVHPMAALHYLIANPAPVKYAPHYWVRQPQHRL